MDKVLSLLGIAARARRLVSGEQAVEAALKKGKARLVILAADASDNTKKFFRGKCLRYGAECAEYADKESLGRALGQESRSSVGITDEGFAAAVLSKIREQSPNKNGESNGYGEKKST